MKNNHNHRRISRIPDAATNVHLNKALKGARLELDNLNAQLIVFAIVAHFRAGHVSIKNAARRCMMTEDDFKRAATIVDNEARKMLAELPQ